MAQSGTIAAKNWEAGNENTAQSEKCVRDLAIDSRCGPNFRPPDLGRQKQRRCENTMNLKCREASEWNSPPQLRRGGRDIKKNAAKPPLMVRREA